MNPQFLPPPEISSAPQPLWTIGAALVLTALMIAGLMLGAPTVPDSPADVLTLTAR